MSNIPAFAPKTLMGQFTSTHEVTQDFYNTAQSALRYYSVDAPLSIGFMSRPKRLEAARQLISEVDTFRSRKALSDTEAAMLLLRLVLQNSRCNKAMKVFHFEWYYEGGAIAVPGWMSLLGYEAEVFCPISDR